MSIPFITGTIAIQSNMTIEEVGQHISEKLFGGIRFQGLERRIYDEVPAVFIEHDILGLRIILSGYSGFETDKRFVLSIYPMNFTKIYGHIDSDEMDLSEYIHRLMERYLEGNKDIILMGD